MKYLIKPLIFIGILGAAFVGLALSGYLPSAYNPFKVNEIEMEQTVLQVDDVKAVAKLFTQQYVNEIILREKHVEKGFFSNTEDKLVIIAQGTCYAGTDLTSMKQEDIQIIDSVSCEVTMPKAIILESTINPSGFRTFISEGYWDKNFKAVQKVKKKAVKQLENMAKKANILEKADEKSVSVMKNFMQSVGFKNVNIIIK